ncbi:beta-hydroxylase [Parasphingorhabdus marina DSM 22363]|uniref:Beta-hydroxylase n=1 Tax=Parasphingorhabdus marina DSM 22363 TaxID=1123272 RepID=A0A1N6G961_9SPHN|nr:aspartyl/asparaginyl beta-hydroxylase domain-containing protein [Parasphingorhabdus marina]SIO04073.1 beta-hydroxylase [Parasphingorhabdus marina DSM 22363]
MMKKDTATSKSDTGHNQNSRPLILRIGKKLRKKANLLASSQSLIPTTPLHQSDIFPWTSQLGEQWQGIAAEAAGILQNRSAVPPLKDISPDHARIAGDGNWKSFFLVGYGYRVEENCARAPKTAALIDQIPDLNSAFFSILEPGAVIPKHRGVTRGLVTCHLGLDIPVPKENCWMQVDDQRVHWKNGEWLVFDDSYSHEVKNETGQTRVILLIQVKRPMRLLGKVTLDLALWGIRRSPFVQDARQNLDKWEEAFRLAEDNRAA